jgi:hypothetical protein
MKTILRLIWELAASSMVSKTPQKAKKVLTKLAKRGQYERSNDQAFIGVNNKVFGSYVMLQPSNQPWNLSC